MLRSSVRRLTLVVVAVGLILATGCSRVPSNTPESYTATSAGNPEPVTQTNFMVACRAGFEDPNATTTAQPAVEQSTDGLCSCIYAKIVAEVPFDTFKDYDQQLKDDPTDVPKQYRQFADQCAGRASETTDTADTTTTSAP
jgi:hypothetical protein